MGNARLTVRYTRESHSAAAPWIVAAHRYTLRPRVGGNGNSVGAIAACRDWSSEVTKPSFGFDHPGSRDFSFLARRPHESHSRYFTSARRVTYRIWFSHLHCIVVTAPNAVLATLGVRNGSPVHSVRE